MTETKKEPTYVRMDHPLKEENNWDISNELIMPGEAFYTVPKFEVTYDHGYYGQTAKMAIQELMMIRKFRQMEPIQRHTMALL